MVDESRKHRDYYLRVERQKSQMQKDLARAFDEIAELQADKRKLWKLVFIVAMLAAGLMKIVDHLIR